MVTAPAFPLDRRRLRQDAEALSAFGDEVVGAHRLVLDERATLAGTGFAGEAADAALSALAETAGQWLAPYDAIQAVARLLGITAELQQQLDHALIVVIARLDPLMDRSLAVAAILASLRAMGEVLDLACALQIDALCTAVLPDPTRSWLDFPDEDLEVIHEYLLLSASAEVVELAREHPDLWILEAPEGGLVAAVGDVASADSVTTYVAGVGSSDPASWSDQIDRTRALAEAADGAGIVWLGYRAPDTVVEAVDQRPATTAGADLAAFQRELARRYPEQHRAVVGFSYGSVVAGAAATRDNGGLIADDLVLLGSPGVGVDHASELKLVGENPQVHAATAEGDPIGLVTTPLTGVHGPDPTSRRFGANVWQLPSPGDHGSYWQPPRLSHDEDPGAAGPDHLDSEFLRAFSRVMDERIGASE